jgi:hypothetical protein
MVVVYTQMLPSFFHFGICVGGTRVAEVLMHDMADRLKRKARKEILYSRGYQAMHKERYLEYLNDMQVARQRGDMKWQAEVAEDLRDFAGEMWNLMRMEQSAYRRIYGLTAGHPHPSAIIPDTATPEGEPPRNLSRLVKTRREGG